jgi:Protein of unknown function (DUF1761)
MNKINYAAVIVAGIAYWLVQAGWYTAFRDPYIAALGLTPDQAAEAAKNISAVPYITALLANMVVAYVIGIVSLRTGEPTVAHGMRVALVMWMGFVVTNFATMYSFEQRPFALLAINSGSTLVGMLLSGAIVGAWTRKAPAA